MQTQSNGEVRNGVSNGHVRDEEDEGGNTNGNSPPPSMSLRGNEDLVRIIGQHLISLGLSKSVETLMDESGCRMDHPVAARFRDHVIRGNWAKANADLQELKDLLENPSTLLEMEFLLLEQKYLELLEGGDIMEALQTLQYELTPLNHNRSRVHRLSAYIMCSTPAQVREQAEWRGRESRGELMERLQQFLPPSVMLPPRRLDALLKQSVEWQRERCPYHNRSDGEIGPNSSGTSGSCGSNEGSSLVVDHLCSPDSFPSSCRQVLSDHTDEVWFVSFSPDGTKLGTGSKDQALLIWDVHPTEFRLTLRKTFDGHQFGVFHLSWSPDSVYLTVCGNEDCPELWVYNTVSNELLIKISPGPEDSLTAAAWHPDNRRFVTGGMRGQFYLCDIEGNVLDSWEGVRVRGIKYRKDGKTVLVGDNHNRIRGYSFDTTNSNFHLVKSEHPLISFTIDSSDRLCLMNLKEQGVHLWDLEDRVLLKKFQGLTQGQWCVTSCFGGVGESFIASGSEDSKVYIWNMKREKPIAVLSGHSRPVTTVSWNPMRVDMLVSGSDDGTVRLWGPSKNPTNPTNNPTNLTSNSISNPISNTSNTASNTASNIITSSGGNVEERGPGDTSSTTS